MKAAPPARMDDILEALESATKLGCLQSIIEKLRDHYKISHMVYHWVNTSGDQFGCGTYSHEWVNRYLERGYLRIDPVIRGCSQSFDPSDWKRFDWSSKTARILRSEAIGYGVGNQGFSVPIRGPNGQFAHFTVTHNCDDETWADFTHTYRRDFILIAHYFNQKALKIAPCRQPKPPQSLSPREVDAMTLLAMGYTRSQVAISLSISEHTLRAYIESARFKLSALNTIHAVARALNYGLIVV